MASVTETLRELVASSDATLYRVAKETGVSWNTLKRFVEGGGLRSEHIDKLAEHYGLTLQPEAPKPTKKAPRKGL